MREFRGASSEREQIRERVDPNYIRPARVSASIEADMGKLTANATLRITRLPWHGRMRRRMAYALRWVWGTHDEA